MSATAENAPNITPNDRLGLTLFLAAAVHAIIILGVVFQAEDFAKLNPPPSLEVLLVQNRSQDKPEQADYFAQLSQTGGGISDEANRPSSPFTSSEITNNKGIAPIPLMASIPQVTENESRPVVTQLYADDKILQKEFSKPADTPRLNQQPIFEHDLEIAQLTTELHLTKQAYAKRPKKLVLTANTHAYAPAHYMHEWVQKVERLGNLNLPSETLQNKIEGTLLLEVEIKWDGTVIETNLLKSSGHKVLDNAALKIVELASPFPPFPAELRDIADHLEIVRTWYFHKGSLQTR